MVLKHHSALMKVAWLVNHVLSNIHFFPSGTEELCFFVSMFQIISVNGHLIVADTMQNLDLLQSSEVQHVALEVEGGIDAQQVTLEEVDMGAEETVDESVSRADQERNSGPETECSAPIATPSEIQVGEVRKGYNIVIIV